MKLTKKQLFNIRHLKTIIKKELVEIEYAKKDIEELEKSAIEDMDNRIDKIMEK